MIKGEVVQLRAMEKEDLNLLKQWRNIESFRKNFREHRELNNYNQEKWFEKTVSSSCDYMFIIERSSDNLPLGACGLLYINWQLRTADFSFYIGYNELYIDNEYAPEAIKLLIMYGFNVLNLNKIWMELYEFDLKKLNIFLEDFNFKKDGKLRQNAFEEGKYFDSYIISLLKDEYDPKS